MIRRIRKPDGTIADIDMGPGQVHFRTLKDAIDAMGGLHALTPGYRVPADLEGWRAINSYTAGWFAKKGTRVK